MHENDLQPLCNRLRGERCSCVIRSGRTIRLFRQRGVRDLYQLLRDEPEFLRGALVADKVVGKGAAALMILGGVEALHAGVLSEPARDLLVAAGVETHCDTLVPHIVNRSQTGRCPLEKRCDAAATAAECLPLIEAFIATLPPQTT
ncbi:DUF1893 domain-containing protein [Alistipes sp.]|uniref:DUF1893 domain-containing protein n=1 Tax=Alistipes sp. TaxID=1872444 RepID=UPI003AEF5A5C